MKHDTKHDQHGVVTRNSCRISHVAARGWCCDPFSVTKGARAAVHSRRTKERSPLFKVPVGLTLCCSGSRTEKYRPVSRTAGQRMSKFTVSSGHITDGARQEYSFVQFPSQVSFLLAFSASILIGQEFLLTHRYRYLHNGEQVFRP